MASGKELRRRINSVRNTQQLTKAMKMVSAAKLRRAQDAILQARPYAIGIKKVVHSVAADPVCRESHALLAERAVKRVNVVLITSDRGLCGAFNANLQKRAERVYREEIGRYEQISFTCVGKRGYEFLKLRGIPVHRYYPDLLKSASFASVTAAAEELLTEYQAGEFDEVRVIYAHFRSAISQVVTTEKILPIETASVGESNVVNNSDQTEFLFEPSREEILSVLLPRYFETMIYGAVLESSASEHGARMAAMDNASRSAGDVIKKLRLVYNNIRQAGITKELLEITSGAEAL